MSFRAVGARDLDVAIFTRARDMDSPRVAADFAVLNEAASDVGLEVDLDLLAAVRAGHEELIVHITETTTFNAKPAKTRKREFLREIRRSRVVFFKKEPLDLLLKTLRSIVVADLERFSVARSLFERRVNTMDTKDTKEGQ